MFAKSYKLITKSCKIMLGKFFLKGLIKSTLRRGSGLTLSGAEVSKMKDMPDAEVDKLASLVEKNPDFFKNIAAEVEQKMKEGKDQMTAVMEVVKKHESTLRNLTNG